MPYKYQIEKGQEKRIFANARNLGDGIVESDEPLESGFLTLVNDKKEELPASSTSPSPTPSTTQPAAAPAVTPATSAAAPKEEAK